MLLRPSLNQVKVPALGSLGFICKPESSLLKYFPTEIYSNWQCWHLVKNWKPIILDNSPADYRTLIKTISHYACSYKRLKNQLTKFYLELMIIILTVDL